MSNTSGVISKHLKGSTELTLIATVKSGLVQLTDPMTHAHRLQRLLATLFEARKLGVERGNSGFVGPLERLRSINAVHWSVLDEGRRLLLAVSFDRPWEPYIRLIVDEAGPILDAIFMHCEGYDDHTTRHGYEQFAEWVRAAQAECNFFFSAFPGLTVDDVTYLQRVREAARAGRPVNLLDAAIPPARPAVTAAQYADYFRTTVGLYRLRSLFPETRTPDPAYSDRAIFDRACATILAGFSAAHAARPRGPQNAGGVGSLPDVPRALANQYHGLTQWYDVIRAARPAPALVESPMDVEQLQGGILEPHLTHAASPEQRLPMTHGCAVLLQFGGNPAALLEHVQAHLHSPAGTLYNIGLTPRGLAKLGLSQHELSRFPPEFLQGMEARAGLLGDIGTNHPDRWERPRHNPEGEAGTEVQLSMIDAVVVLQCRIEKGSPQDYAWSRNHALYAAVSELSKGGTTILHVQALRRHESGSEAVVRDHFGFVDGVSQPEPTAQLAPDSRPNDPPRWSNAVALGEIFLGVPNDRDECNAHLDPILQGGTFLVLRKLRQHAAEFRRFVQTVPAAKLVGRHENGDSDVIAAVAPNSNDFDYQQDDGRGCPLQSHVRLANPRTPEFTSTHGKRMRTPRILRRGFSYGPSTSDTAAPDERGVLFMAYNASIAQQYEVIQRWLNGANSTGLDSSQRDPLTGPVDETGGHTFSYRDGSEVKTVELPSRCFTTVEWGLYLFVPSLPALALLAATQAATRSAAGAAPVVTPDQLKLLGKGQQLLARLLACPDPGPWREALEAQGSGEAALATLLAIRANHRVLRTPMGVLVVGAKEVLDVLSAESTYSARGYWPRMAASEMPMHLGMDRKPDARAVCPVHPASDQREDQPYVDAVAQGAIDYDRESIANAHLRRFTRWEGFHRALIETRTGIADARLAAGHTAAHIGSLLAGAAAPINTSVPASRRATADLWLLAEGVISRLSQDWFGLPDGVLMLRGGQPSSEDDPRAYCPADLTTFSQYVFRAEPDSWTQRLARKRGAAVQRAAASFVPSALKQSVPHPFLLALEQSAAEHYPGAPAAAADLVVRSLVGVVDGFAAASFGSFLSVVGQWLQTQELWRIQKRHEQSLAQLADYARLPLAPAPPETPEPLSNDAPLVQQMVATLKRFPKPPWLHRIVMKDAYLGNVHLKQGERVVVHLGTSALEQPGPDLLFGGGIGSAGYPTHACPAQELAVGVLIGMLAAILELQNVRVEGTLAISFSP